MIGAVIGYLIGRKNKEARNFFGMFVSAAEFFMAAYALIKIASGNEMRFIWEGFGGFGLYLKADGFRALYSAVATFMWLMTTLFSRDYFSHYRSRNRYFFFLFLTLGATVGVFLSGDLFTTFLFFEIMSLTSYVMVIHDEKPGSMRAGETYISIAVIGGMVLLMGLFLLFNAVGRLDIDLLKDACVACENKTTIYVAAGLMLFGFGAKAGMFPLHVWLPKAHPVAPAPASALLSGILTKSGIFGVLVISCDILFHDSKWGMTVLIFGVVTMFLGALIALFSIDLKRTLACSSVSQIGFILVGIGMQGLLGEENALAVRGTLLHMVNHSMFKLLLFMVAGVVFMNLHKLDLNEIRGFGRNKPILNFCFLMGLLGIAGVPLWSGYVSKTLLHESIVEYIHHMHGGIMFNVIEYIFLISGGLTCAYMTKLYIAIFVEKGNGSTEEGVVDGISATKEKGRYMSTLTLVVLVITALIPPVLGILPNVLMDGMADLGQGFMHGVAHESHVEYFSWTNLKGSVISILIGAVIYIVVVRKLLMKKDESGNTAYINAWPEWFDLENLIYRPVIQNFLPAVGMAIASVFDRLVDTITDVLQRTVFAASEKGEKIKEFPFMHERTETEKVSREISTGFSFGMLLFGVGFCLVILFLLIS